MNMLMLSNTSISLLTCNYDHHNDNYDCNIYYFRYIFLFVNGLSSFISDHKCFVIV